VWFIQNGVILLKAPLWGATMLVNVLILSNIFVLSRMKEKNPFNKKKANMETIKDMIYEYGSDLKFFVKLPQ
jgi:hypothetical protein